MRVAALLLLALAPRTVSDQEVAKVQNSVIFIDTHNDAPMRVMHGWDIASTGTGGSTDLQRLRAGNVAAVFFAAYVPATHAKTGDSADYCRKVIRAIREGIVGKHAHDFTLARTADEIEAAHGAGKIAALIGIEGGHAIEDSTKLLREFFDLGARYMTLTHTNSNGWADSSGDKPRYNGLNDLGRRIVAEMNRLGMIVDISHVSDETFRDVLEVSKAPVFASHSSCRALSNAKRNMTDDMIRALSAKGGVIQINFACSFLNEKIRTDQLAERRRVQSKFGEDMVGLRAAIEKEFPRANLEDVVNQIDHAVRIGGIDHVGIGSDFDGVDCAPTGLDDYSKVPALTRALLQRGYTAEQIRKIYGGNTLRLMREVEKTARKGPAA